MPKFLYRFLQYRRGHRPNTLFEAYLAAMALFGRQNTIIEDLPQGAEHYQSILKRILALGRIVTKISQQHACLGVLMPNSNNTLALLLGMSAFGRVPALMNYTAKPETILNACLVANIKTIITSRKFVEVAKLEGLITQISSLQIVYLEDLRNNFSWFDRLWLVAYAIHFPRAVIPPVTGNDTAFILFTSGSEGRPKAVLLSHKNILANINQVMRHLDFNRQDKFMMSLPLFHAFGLTGSLLPLLNGIPLLLYPSPLHYKAIPSYIQSHACTVLISTSTFLGHYAKFAQRSDFSTLRIVVAGAEKLNEVVRDLYRDHFGIEILEGYGTTECAPVLSANKKNAIKFGSVGQLLPDIQYKLKPVDGIEDGSVLVVAGDNIMQGYYLPEQPGVLVPPENGWYDTGDVVSIDNEGFIFIKGRLKRFAKVAGEMVSLDTVEKIANHAAPDGSHAAIACSEVSRGESIVIFSSSPTLNREALIQSAKQLDLSSNAIAREIYHLHEIPLLGSGKTDYMQLNHILLTLK